jgi:hypothetical protein
MAHDLDGICLDDRLQINCSAGEGGVQIGPDRARGVG